MVTFFRPLDSKELTFMKNYALESPSWDVMLFFLFRVDRFIFVILWVIHSQNLCNSHFRALSVASKERELAKLPPRGWNSYDSFSWAINEQEFLDNAEIVAQRLLPYGYEVRSIVKKKFNYYTKYVEYH